jgi:uncharacterized protein YbjT (DUF2867 family)
LATRNAIIAGATGLTGGHLLASLLADARYAHVHALVRKPTPPTLPLTFPPHVKLDEHVVDYRALASLPAADDAYCCLGTTIKKAGSQAAFREVDFDYVLNFARAAKASGAKRFMVISALGATATSGVFYNRVKGEMEDALAQLGFEALHIFRPSLLDGDRGELRVVERVSIGAFKLLSPFMIGGARKYRLIAAEQVAHAMHVSAWSAVRGVNFHESDEIAAVV